LVCPENPVDWNHVIVALVGHSHVLADVLVGFFILKRLPWLIAAFRVAIAKNNDEAERARNALEALDPPWHWIWQRRG
jgi:hypothetical protein